MRRRFGAAAVIGALCMLAATSGCGGNDLVVGGMLPVTPTAVTSPTPSGCIPFGQLCSLSSTCCAGSCISTDGVNLICQ